MVLNDEQFAVLLQACIDFAKQMLEEQGGFYPFGARVQRDGEIDFIQPVPQTDPADMQELYRETERMLTEYARNDEILAAAIVADTESSAEFADQFREAISVLIDAPGYCRLIYQPYRLMPDASSGKAGTVETGKMFPLEAKQTVFASDGR